MKGFGVKDITKTLTEYIKIQGILKEIQHQVHSPINQNLHKINPGIMVMVVILTLVAFVLVSAFTIIVANVNIIFIQVIKRSTFL